MLWLKVLAAIFMMALLFSTLVATAHFGTVQATITWTQTYGRAEFDRACSLVETSDGGYVIAGTTGPFGTFGTGSDDFWLIKTDAFGIVEWNQTYGGPEPYRELAASLVETSDGGYVIAGTTHPSDYFGDFWLVKTDAYGNEEWNQTYGGIEGEWLYSMVEASDGGYAMVGTWDLGIFGGSGYTNNSWLIKTDADGNMEWNQTYTGGNAHALVVTSDGGYAIAGTQQYDSEGTGGWTDFWLIKTDAFGIVEWNQTYGGQNEEEADLLVEASDGGYVIAGTTAFSDLVNMTSTVNPWLVKTDASGNVEWNQTYDDNYGWSELVEASDGGYVIAGEWIYDSFDAAVGMSDLLLIKTDEFGTVQWNQTDGGADQEGAVSLVEASDGGYVIAGNFKYSSLDDVDILLIKTDEFGFVPEASWVVLPLLVTATVAILISKKKLLHQRSKEK